MNFLPVAILAYALNGGAAIIDKILLNKSVPSPFAYVFYISAMGLLVVFLIPFGVTLNSFAVIYSVLAGIFGNLALLTYFQSLKKGDASIVAPIVGGFNPLFALILGSVFLGQILNPLQLLAFFILMLGAVILTHNLWSKKLQANSQLLLMAVSGFLFALSYILLKEAFSSSNFVTGLVISRLTGALFVIIFLLHPKTRSQIFSNNVKSHGFLNKTSMLLLLGQIFGASSGLLITYGVSFASPALVNALFGVQYLVILGAALILGKKHPQLLEENLTKSVLAQKIAGAGILSLGVYLLSR